MAIGEVQVDHQNPVTVTKESGLEIEVDSYVPKGMMVHLLYVQDILKRGLLMFNKEGEYVLPKKC